MTLKQKAILQTAGILAAIVSISVATTFLLAQFTTTQIINGLAIASVLFLIYSMYGVVLSRLEYDEKLKEMVDKR